MPAPHVPGWDSRRAVLKQAERVRLISDHHRVILARRMWKALSDAKTLDYRTSLVADFDALLKRAASSGTFGALMAGLDALGTPE